MYKIVILFIFFHKLFASNEICRYLDDSNLAKPLLNVEKSVVDTKLALIDIKFSKDPKYFKINEYGDIYLIERIPKFDYEQRIIIGVDEVGTNSRVRVKRFCWIVPAKELILSRQVRQVTIGSSCVMQESDINARCLAINDVTNNFLYYFDTCDNDYLLINEATGVISPKTSFSLDYETVKSLSITVEKYSKTAFIRVEVKLINITITDQNDESPVFQLSHLSNPVLVSLYNGTNTIDSTLVLKAQATDADSNSQLIYSFSQTTETTTLQKFNINSVTGDVFTVGNSFVSGGIFYLVVRVTDINTMIPSRRSTDILLIIYVDTIPVQFTQSLYQFNFISTFTNNWNTSFGRVLAYDSKNLFNQIKIVSTSSLFIIDSNGNCYFNSLIKVNEVQRFWFFTVSIDGDANIKAMVTVSVKVLKTAVQFQYPNNVVYVEENKICGKANNLIYLNQWEDIDPAIKLTYSSPTNFYIGKDSAQNAIIYTKKYFDYEVLPIYNKYEIITISIPSVATATVTVSIMNSDDNRPLFCNANETISISQSIIIKSVIYQAIGCDNDLQDTFHYFVNTAGSAVTAINIFSINPTTGLVTIETAPASDTPITVTILSSNCNACVGCTTACNNCIDCKQPKADISLVTIKFTKYNNNAPVVVCESLVSIDENKISSIPVIKATDIDNDVISYRILPNSVLSDAMISKLSVAANGSLIYNSLDADDLNWVAIRQMSYLTIQASDSGSPSYSIFCHTKLNVNNTDDNIPVFIPPHQNITIAESQKTNTVIYVYAQDKDDFQLETPSNIVYSFVNPNVANIYATITKEQYWAVVKMNPIFVNQTVLNISACNSQCSYTTIIVTLKNLPSISFSISSTFYDLNSSSREYNLTSYNASKNILGKVYPEGTTAKIYAQSNSIMLQNVEIDKIAYLIIRITMFDQIEADYYWDRMIFVKISIKTTDVTIMDLNYYDNNIIVLPKEKQNQILTNVLVIFRNGTTYPILVSDTKATLIGSTIKIHDTKADGTRQQVLVNYGLNTFPIRYQVNVKNPTFNLKSSININVNTIIQRYSPSLLDGQLAALDYHYILMNHNTLFFVNTNNCSLLLLKEPPLNVNSYLLTIRQYSSTNYQDGNITVNLENIPTYSIYLATKSISFTELKINFHNLSNAISYSNMQYSLVPSPDSTFFDIINNNNLTSKPNILRDFPNGREIYYLTIRSTIGSTSNYSNLEVLMIDINNNGPILTHIDLLRFQEGNTNSIFPILSDSDPDIPPNNATIFATSDTSIAIASRSAIRSTSTIFNPLQLTTFNFSLTATQAGFSTQNSHVTVMVTSGYSNYQTKFLQSIYNIRIHSSDLNRIVASVIVAQPIPGITYTLKAANSFFTVTTNTKIYGADITMNAVPTSNGNFIIVAAYKAFAPAETTIQYTIATIPANPRTFDLVITNIANTREDVLPSPSTILANIQLNSYLDPTKTSVIANIPTQLQEYIKLEKINDIQYNLIQDKAITRTVIPSNSTQANFTIDLIASSTLLPFPSISRSINFNFTITKFSPQTVSTTFSVSENKNNIVVITNQAIEDPAFPNAAISISSATNIQPNHWQYFTLSYLTPNKFSLALTTSIDREAFLPDKSINSAQGYLPINVVYTTQTSTITLTFSVQDVSESLISNGYSEVIAQSFEWWNYSYAPIEEPIGRMQVSTTDLDMPEVTFVKVADQFTDGAFKINSDGNVLMANSLSESKYELKAKATQGSTTVDSTMLVSVQKWSFDGLQNSLIIRQLNLTCAEFYVKRKSSNAASITNLDKSIMENLRAKIASILGKPETNVFVKCVAESSSPADRYIDILVASRGSPFIKKSKLQNDLTNAQADLLSILPGNSSLTSLPLDQCSTEQSSKICSTGCINQLNINVNKPFSITDSLNYVAACGCSTTNIPSLNCGQTNACFNQGNCTNIQNGASISCVCLPGYFGPQCQSISVGLKSTTSFIWASQNMGACSTFAISLSLISGISNQKNAQLLFIGPSTNFSENTMDFLSLILVNDRALALHVNLGSLIISLELSTLTSISTGDWLDIDLGLKDKKLYLIFNRCKPNSTGTSVDPGVIPTANCYIEKPITGSSFALNVAVAPIIVGGLSNHPKPENQYMYKNSFVGTIHNLRVNGQLQDLDISDRSTNRDIAVRSTEMDQSCKNAAGSDLCGTNGYCWGVWNGGVATGQCECRQGYFQANKNSPCDSTSPEILIANFTSVPQWTLNDVEPFSNPSITNLAFYFRSLQLSGTLVYLQAYNNSYYNNETIKLHLDGGKLYLTSNLGGYQFQRYQVVSNQLNDGQWHSVAVERIMNAYEILIDGGAPGNYFNQLLSPTNQYNNLPLVTGKVVLGVQRDLLPVNIISEIDLLSSSCLKDPTVEFDKLTLATTASANYIPASNFQSCPVALTTCTSACIIPFVCKESWNGQSICICPTGFSVGSTCFNRGSCNPNPCRSSGICYLQSTAPGYFCLCPNGFVGQVCDVSLAAVIVPIITVIILIIIILILLILAKRRSKEMLPYESDRENIISYNESAGEVDNKSFDLFQLQKALNNPNAFNGSVASNPSKLNPYLSNEKMKAESDPGGYPNDFPLDYGYEGEGSDVNDKSDIGSISLYSSLSEDEQN